MIDREDFWAQFGRLVANGREQAKLSQRAFASAVGISRASLANIERGRQGVSLYTVYLMADILRRDVRDLAPPLRKVAAELHLPGDHFEKLSSRERRQLRNLSPKELNSLNKIVRARP